MAITLSLDAMGGDVGPSVTVEGASLFLASLKDAPHIFFLFHGDEPSIAPFLEKYPRLFECSRIVHSDKIVTNDMKPALAVRLGKKSNMARSIMSVLDGEAQAVVSAGNTGAYMGLSKIILKTIEGVDRPAIPAVLPTLKGKTLVLDLGANLDCSAEHLVQFALMGTTFFEQLFNVSSPRVGLLNVGSEDLKGNAVVQAAAQQMQALSLLSFHGFVEGDDIAKGTTDVVVTDGFTGNIALKSIEGTARLIKGMLSECLTSSFLGKCGYLLARSCFKQLGARLDPRFYNGALFLGLRHIAVKSHGGTDAFGFSKAIDVAYRMVQMDFINHLERRFVSRSEQHFDSLVM